MDPDAASPTLSIPPVLLAQIKQAADEEHRPVAEVLEDLIERGLEERRWQRSVAYGQARAKALGLIESDVHGLIADVRLERRQEQARD